MIVGQAVSMSWGVTRTLSWGMHHARSASSSARENAVEPFGHWLRVLAEIELPRRLRKRLDASDVLQETLLRAQMAVAPEGKRDVRLERSLEAALEQSSRRLQHLVASKDPSPSQQAKCRDDFSADTPTAR